MFDQLGKQVRLSSYSINSVTNNIPKYFRLKGGYGIMEEQIYPDGAFEYNIVYMNGQGLQKIFKINRTFYNFLIKLIQWLKV
jgi:hypothetical protein